MPPAAAVNENFSGHLQYGATSASYNAPQTEFQPSNNPFARPTEFNQSDQYSSQNDYRQNYRHLLAARRAANEGSAISSMRTLAAAEQTYIATMGAGNCGDLQSMSSAGLIDKVLAGGEKSGYRFTVKVLGQGSCEISATPTVSKGVSSTGNRSFYSSSVDDWKIHAANKDGDPAGLYDKEIK